MSEPKTVALHAAVPIFTVADLAEAIDWYQRVLGFQVGWKWGDPPEMASVCRERVEINLLETADASRTTSRVYVHMDGVDRFYEQITAAGANVAVPLADRAYGMRDFRTTDPSGNELSFGEAAST
jgi:uncharacterized glyoxalase superfamily protein PhnB